MLKKIKNSFFIISFLLFFILVTNFYFSDDNIKSTNKTRSYYLNNVNSNVETLPLLKNDTFNIIEYSDDLNNYKKKRKKRFWEKLLKNKI